MLHSHCTNTLIITLIALALATVTAQISNNSRLLLVGGNLQSTNLYRRFIEMNEAPEGQKFIGLITAASDSPQESAQFYQDQFASLGVNHSSWIPIDEAHISNNANKSVLSAIARMTGIFVGGGDQRRLVRCFCVTTSAALRMDSPALALIRARFRSGELAIAGTSAGTAIMQGDGMVTGGEAYEALVGGAFPYVDERKPDNLSFDPLGGFNLFDFGLLDSVRQSCVCMNVSECACVCKSIL